MTSIVTSAGAVGDHPHGPFHKDTDTASASAEPEPAPTASPATVDATDVRLIIEDDQAGGGIVYTTVDRRTGAVIRQLPRERLLKLGEASDYAAGALIKARV